MSFAWYGQQQKKRTSENVFYIGFIDLFPSYDIRILEKPRIRSSHLCIQFCIRMDICGVGNCSRVGIICITKTLIVEFYVVK